MKPEEKNEEEMIRHLAELLGATSPEAEDAEFNQMEIYKQRIFPVMEKLSALCSEYRIPHLFWVIPMYDKERTGNGLIMKSDHPAARKMSLMGNIIDGTISLLDMAKAAFTYYMLTHTPMKGKENEKE